MSNSVPPKLENLTRLLVHELHELHEAEHELATVLPQLAEAVHDDELRDTLTAHLTETREHLRRLDEILTTLNAPPQGMTVGARGLIEEALALTHVKADRNVQDAALIIALQKIKHYEIASYGSARTLANVLGLSEAAEQLQMNLDDESALDDRLSDLAESINVDATITDVDEG